MGGSIILKPAMSILIHPTYFGSVEQFGAIAKSDKMVFEVQDNYQKQTYRNRMYIYGANGKLLLNIPIKHNSGKGRQKYRDVKIENDFPWQKEHFKSLESAYRTSPFFEFYEDEIAPLYQKKHRFLMDFNFECFDLITDFLQLEANVSRTVSYEKEVTGLIDLRHLVNAKKEPSHGLTKYTQVFKDKHQFIPNLSILDLLFSEGPNTLTFLEAQDILW